MGISCSPAVNRPSFKMHTRTHAAHKPTATSLYAPYRKEDSTASGRVKGRDWGRLCSSRVILPYHSYIITKSVEEEVRVIDKDTEIAQGLFNVSCLNVMLSEGMNKSAKLSSCWIH